MFSSCGGEPKLSYIGETVDFEELKADDTTETKNIYDESTTVYWSKSGSVWHINRECSALSRTKEICLGSKNEAIEAGMERLCQKCS
ncbi:MAG: hypothetical protein IJZ89_01175 [Clostridia bacterium]|nr:hypothetical protein [Clostridia bacterium]